MINFTYSYCFIIFIFFIFLFIFIEITAIQICLDGLQQAEEKEDIDTKQNNIEMMRLLVDIGGDINITDSSGKSVLHHAVLKEQSAVGRLLLELVAHPFTLDDAGRTPVHYAVKTPAAQTNYFFGTRLVQDVIEVWWNFTRKQMLRSFIIFIVCLALFTTVCIYQTTRNSRAASHTTISIKGKKNLFLLCSNILLIFIVIYNNKNQ